MKRSIIAAGFLAAASALSFTALAFAQPAEPRIGHRTYVGYFVPFEQDVGTMGTLKSTTAPLCTFNLIPSTYEDPGAGVGPQGGRLMQGSGSCTGMFELDIYPYSVGNSFGGLQAGNVSDFGITGRFTIESVTLSTNNPHGYPPHYSTITTGTVTILHSPRNDLGGTQEGPYAVMLDGMTTVAAIN
jgi:hypothetical protein